ncbi:MAG: acyltransferase family protein [Nitrospinota bacterium]
MMTSESERGTQRAYELDALRGIAAFSILLFHYFVVFKYIQKGKIPESIFTFGVTGVDLFFIISGYVIFMTVKKNTHWKGFLVSRFSRLYPAYWVSILLTAGGLKMVSPENRLLKTEVVLGNLTMVQRWMGLPDVNPPYWTLSVELMFYLVVFLFLFSGTARKIGKSGGILVAVLLAGIILSHISANYSTFIKKNFPLFAHANLFYAGILFYIVNEQGNTILRAIGLLSMLGMVFPLHSLGGTTQDFMGPIAHTLIVSFYFLLFFLFVTGRLGFIAKKGLVFLGDISYSLYLLHQTIGFIFILFFLEKGLSHTLSVCLTVFLVVLLSWLVTILIEKPSTRRLRRLLLSEGGS